MNNRFAFFAFTLSFFVSLVATSAGWAAKTAGKTLLPDGFILRGVEGKLNSFDANEGWFFEFDSAVKYDKDVLKAGTNLKLLPSSTLERMIADANDRSLASAPVAEAAPATGAGANYYRLWARVTKYKERNFIFPEYFLPLGKAEPSPPSTVQQSQEKAQPIISEPNDELAIPKQILEKLEGRRTVPQQQISQQTAIKQNYVLANRTGFISSCVPSTALGAGVRDAYCEKKNTQYAIRNTQYVFVFDALGRNIQQTSLRLLPCQTLELAQQIQVAEPDPVRFKIAGIVTEYKGQCFLLLQQATRVYSHDNFGR